MKRATRCTHPATVTYQLTPSEAALWSRISRNQLGVSLRPGIPTPITLPTHAAIPAEVRHCSLSCHPAASWSRLGGDPYYWLVLNTRRPPFGLFCHARTCCRVSLRQVVAVIAKRASAARNKQAILCRSPAKRKEA